MVFYRNMMLEAKNATALARCGVKNMWYHRSATLQIKNETFLRVHVSAEKKQQTKKEVFCMTIKSARRLQIIALVLVAIAAVLCCVVAVKPEWVGITGLGEFRAIPIAALVASVGFVAVDIFYLVMLVRAKTSGNTKAAVIISALLLCILAVVVEPVIYTWEARQLQLQELQVGNAARVIALISAKQGVRELVRLILFASGALSFLSMGGFWGKHTDEAEQ